MNMRRVVIEFVSMAAEALSSDCAEDSSFSVDDASAAMVLSESCCVCVAGCGTDVEDPDVCAVC